MMCLPMSVLFCGSTLNHTTLENKIVLFELKSFRLPDSLLKCYAIRLPVDQWEKTSQVFLLHPLNHNQTLENRLLLKSKVEVNAISYKCFGFVLFNAMPLVVCFQIKSQFCLNS